MTNNDVNAWSINSPHPKLSWDQQVEHFSEGQRNFPIRSFDGRYLQDTTPQTRSKHETMYSAILQAQTQDQPYIKEAYTAPQPQPYDLPYPEDLNTVLSTGYGQSDNSQEQSSFTAFKNCRNPTSQPQQTFDSSFASSATTEDPFVANKLSPNTVYSDDSTMNTTVNSYESARSSSTTTVDRALNTWWADRRNCGPIYNSNGFEMQFSHHGLPMDSAQQDTPGIQLNVANSANDWSDELLRPPDTVTPRALNINQSFNSIVTVSSSRDPSTHAFSETSTALDIQDEMSSTASSTGRQMVVEEPATHYPQIATTRPPNSEEIVTNPRQDLVKKKPITKIVLINRNTANKLPKQITLMKKERAKAITPTLSAVANTRSHTQKAEASIAAPNLVLTCKDEHRKLRTKLPSEPQTRKLSDRDEFLVSSKRAGMSYKDIRAKGEFTEAESTLRGRFRTLTKAKEDRVRKPEWTDNDVRLLKKAVKKFGGPNHNVGAKVSWKKVAEYIADKGGSYQFGYATCRKRWDDLEQD